MPKKIQGYILHAESLRHQLEDEIGRPLSRRQLVEASRIHWERLSIEEKNMWKEKSKLTRFENVCVSVSSTSASDSASTITDPSRQETDDEEYFDVDSGDVYELISQSDTNHDGRLHSTNTPHHTVPLMDIVAHPADVTPEFIEMRSDSMQMDPRRLPQQYSDDVESWRQRQIRKSSKRPHKSRFGDQFESDNNIKDVYTSPSKFKSMRKRTRDALYEKLVWLSNAGQTDKPLCSSLNIADLTLNEHVDEYAGDVPDSVFGRSLLSQAAGKRMEAPPLIARPNHKNNDVEREKPQTISSITNKLMDKKDKIQSFCVLFFGFRENGDANTATAEEVCCVRFSLEHGILDLFHRWLALNRSPRTCNRGAARLQAKEHAEVYSTVLKMLKLVKEPHYIYIQGEKWNETLATMKALGMAREQEKVAGSTLIKSNQFRCFSDLAGVLEKIALNDESRFTSYEDTERELWDTYRRNELGLTGTQLCCKVHAGRHHDMKPGATFADRCVVIKIVRLITALFQRLHYLQPNSCMSPAKLFVSTRSLVAEATQQVPVSARIPPIIDEDDVWRPSAQDEDEHSASGQINGEANPCLVFDARMPTNGACGDFNIPPVTAQIPMPSMLFGPPAPMYMPRMPPALRATSPLRFLLPNVCTTTAFTPQMPVLSHPHFTMPRYVMPEPLRFGPIMAAGGRQPFRSHPMDNVKTQLDMPPPDVYGMLIDNNNSPSPPHKQPITTTILSQSQQQQHHRPTTANDKPMTRLPLDFNDDMWKDAEYEDEPAKMDEDPDLGSPDDSLLCSDECTDTDDELTITDHDSKHRGFTAAAFREASKPMSNRRSRLDYTKGWLEQLVKSSDTGSSSPSFTRYRNQRPQNQPSMGYSGPVGGPRGCPTPLWSCNNNNNIQFNNNNGRYQAMPNFNIRQRNNNNFNGGYHSAPYSNGSPNGQFGGIPQQPKRPDKLERIERDRDIWNSQASQTGNCNNNNNMDMRTFSDGDNSDLAVRSQSEHDDSTMAYYMTTPVARSFSAQNQSSSQPLPTSTVIEPPPMCGFGVVAQVDDSVEEEYKQLNNTNNSQATNASNLASPVVFTDYSSTNNTRKPAKPAGFGRGIKPY